MPPHSLRLAVAAAAASLALAACGGAPGAAPRPAPAPPPAPTSAATPAPAAATPTAAAPVPPPPLPPIPHITGALNIRVVYPTAGATIAARDSTFIFGSVGNGDATLRINGAPVEVKPNGSFLAWLPVPPAGSSGYTLVATLGPDTARATHRVTVPRPRPPLADTGRLVVDTASVTPRGSFALRDDDPVRVSVRAPANARAWVSYGLGAPAGAPQQRQLLVSDAARPGSSLTGGTAPASVPSRYLGDARLWSTDLTAAQLRQGGVLFVARGRDTVRFALSRIEPATDSLPHWAMLGAEASGVSDTDRVVIGRPTPGGTYKWFLFPGTVVRVTGRREESARIRLDSLLDIWVPASEVRLMPPGYASPDRVASNARVVPGADWTDVVIPIGDRPPFLVEEQGSSLELTLYGTRATTDIINYARNDSLVRNVRWEQVSSDRAKYTINLAAPPFGYLVLFERGSIVVRVRRPPAIDAAAPLRGVTIAVDPGHPPAGATGPTGLYEGDATLLIGQALRNILEQRGAHVVMTRTTPAAVDLGERPIIARRANADLLVSIHLNALPDGINPFTTNGTGTYFFHPQAEPLARLVQRGMVRRMGLRDLGINYDNLALTRETWMPSILCEGAFVIIPEQEAALRTPEFQQRYALGVADGIEEYFRSLATKR